MLEVFKLLLKIYYNLLLILLNPVIIIPLLLFIGIRYFTEKKYKNKSYYKVTNTSYYDTMNDIGKFGEYLVYKKIESFEKNGAKFLFNMYVPIKGEKTTEIDVLMISRKGLFVFESKNHSGWIFGNENQKYWYQILPKGYGKSHKEKFYNPIFQNNTHIKYLKMLVGNEIPVYSIIAFSDRCTLKKINVRNPDVIVVNRNKIYGIVSSIYHNCSEDVLTDIQIEKIYNKLYPYTQVDNTIKQKHIDDIRNKKYIKEDSFLEENDNDIEKNALEDNKNDIIEIECDDTKSNDSNEVENIEKELINDYNQPTCPICGAKLIIREVKYGEHAGEKFYGCSNYPKCRYIEKIQ